MLSVAARMSAAFAHVTEHRDTPAPLPLGGRVVLSRLGAGESLIGAPSLSIKFVLEGEERYRIDGRTAVANPGQFLLLDRGAPCVAEVRGRERTLGLCLYMPARETEGPETGTRRSFVMPTAGNPLAAFLAEVAARLAVDPTRGPELADQVLAKAAGELTRLQDELDARAGELPAVRTTTRRDLLERLERARAHLHDNTGRAVNQAELARVAAMSQFHLARLFRAAFGEAPGAYHRRLRLSAAADGMRADQLSVAQAAERAGYADVSSFSHAFRRLFGRPPSATA
jgi:AraC-like DNA-binding protein